MSHRLQEEPLISLPTGLLCSLDRKGSVLRAGPAWEAVVGLPLASLEGTKLISFIHAEDRALALETLEQSLLGSAPVPCETRFLHAGGGSRWLRWSVSAQEGEALVLLATEVVVDDISESGALDQIRALEERLAAATAALEARDRELESLSSSIAHDLRAPLRAIDGFTRVVLEDSGRKIGDTGRDHLGRVLAATSKMSSVIDDLLALARLSRAPMKIERVDLSKIALRYLQDRPATSALAWSQGSWSMATAGSCAS
jgi:PAS domain S-box-containing protein